jgi:hypothetical protein
LNACWKRQQKKVIRRMLKIDKKYIDIAIKIRKEYFSELEMMKSKEEILNHYKNEVQLIYDDLEKIVSSYNGIVETDEPFQKELNSRLNEIEKIIVKTQKSLEPHLKKIEDLRKQSDILYNSIIDKYPELTSEEIQNQISEYLK